MGFCYDKVSILVHNCLIGISNFPLLKLCILLCNDSGHFPNKFEEFLSVSCGQCPFWGPITQNEIPELFPALSSRLSNYLKLFSKLESSLA